MRVPDLLVVSGITVNLYSPTSVFLELGFLQRHVGFCEMLLKTWALFMQSELFLLPCFYNYIKLRILDDIKKYFTCLNKVLQKETGA
jgi:hypothetical protein